MKSAEIVLVFAKLGLFSFGGGHAALPLFAAEVVGRHGWLDPGRFTSIVALAQLLPGPILLNTTVLAGTSVAGAGGGLVAAGSFVLPSFLVMLALSRIYARHKGNSLTKRAVSGLAPVATGLLVGACFLFAGQVSLSWKTLLITCLSGFLLGTGRLDVFRVLLLASILGVIL